MAPWTKNEGQAIGECQDFRWEFPVTTCSTYRSLTLSTDVTVPAISWSDVKLGSILGDGAFATVHTVSQIKHGAIFDAESNHMERFTTTDLKPTQISIEVFDSACARPTKLALKTLKKIENGDISAAVKGFFIEASLLLKLSSSCANIVAIRAISVNFWDNPLDGFIILEKLTETLHDRLRRWRTPKQPVSIRRHVSDPMWQSFSNAWKNHSHMNRQQSQKERIRHVAVGVAQALEFLHRHKIIYRDIKPSNIGFDVDDNVKLFDFGLARDFSKTEGQLCTGSAGTARYMAPELSGVGNYSFSADVWSFSILLWEICTLDRPFEKIRSLENLHKLVLRKNARPSLRKVLVPGIREVLKVGWHTEPRMRPSFAVIARQLEFCA